MSKQHHLILCTDGIFPHTVGGMQRHSRLLAEYLASRKNLKLTVIHPHPLRVFDAALGMEEISIEGIDVNKNYLAQCYAYSKRVAEQIHQLPKDAIIYSQGLSVWVDIKSFTPRLMVNPHGLEAFQVLSLKEKVIAYPFKRIFSYIFNQSAAVVSLGGKLTNIIKGQLKQSDTQIVVLPNGVELKKRGVFSNANEPLRVLFVGRFAHNKGIGTLFEAIAALSVSGELSHYEFHLTGKGPLFEHYVQTNTYSNVYLHGFVGDEQLQALYHSCDLFLLPTWFEGMPTVVLEAMSFAKPAIVSDVGAAAELVDTRNGYLLEPRNVQQIVEALRDYRCKSREERERMGDNGFQKVQKQFTWDKIAERHEQAVNALANAQQSL
jgi:glycosyltransferase involved in cell wall biosynthesis